MHELTYGLKKISEHESFEFAFIDLYDRLKKDLEDNNMSYQVLETTIWIEDKDNHNQIFFYDARDEAHRLGVLDGQGNITEKFRKAYDDKDLPILRKTKTICCPECSSDDIHRVPPFEYVWECQSCGFSFHKRDE
jgi:hypothetical protein